MDTEQLFTAAKWEILVELAKRPLSPLELSTKVDTSLANISQSLRMLELAGIVTHKRIPNREKGQPRIVYSIKKDVAYPIIIAEGSAHKELIEIDKHKKAIMNTWYYPSKRLQKPIEKFLWEIEEYFEKIDAIAIEGSANKIEFYIYPSNISVKIKTTKISAGGQNYAVSVKPAPAPKGTYYVLDSKKRMEVIPEK